MNDRSAQYVVVEDSFAGSEPLVIRDVGPWDKHLTVTNDAENVVEELIRSNRLLPGQRLLCYDSDNQLDEIVVKDGKFTGFAPGPASEVA